MFNIGFSELIVISIIALFVIGPKQLPAVARAVGRMLNEFRRATEDIAGTFTKTTNDTRDDIHKSTVQVIEATDRLNEKDAREEDAGDHDPFHDEHHDKESDNVHLSPETAELEDKKESSDDST